MRVKVILGLLFSACATPRSEGALTPREEQFLAEHGFVVTSEARKQVFSFYADSPLPVIITTDSVFSGFHTLLEHSVCALEKANAVQLPRFLDAYVLEVAAVGRASPALAEGVHLALRVLLTARLLVSSEPIGMDLRTLVGVDCIADAQAAESVLRGRRGAPEVFGQRIIDSELAPRGFYAKTVLLRDYFVSRALLGLYRFGVDTRNERLAGIVLAMAFRGAVAEHYERLNEGLDWLVGPPDDPTPRHYRTLLLELTGANPGPAELASLDPEQFANLVRARLSAPLVNSAYLDSSGSAARFAQETFGLRILGKRVLLAGMIFMRSPLLDENLLPSGLEVAAAFGSDTARALLCAPESEYGRVSSPVERMKRIEEMRRLVDSHATGRLRDTFPELFVRLERSLLCPKLTPSHPRFMHAEAYQLKSLGTALACWAGLHHTWALLGKRSADFASAVRLPRGIVEPNPGFFRVLALLAQSATAVFRARSVEPARWNALVSLARRLEVLAEKTLRKEVYSKEDADFVQAYGGILAQLCFHDGNVYVKEDACNDYAFCVDVHAELSGRHRLYVGIGRPRAMYVTMEYDGEIVRYRGGVLSYREFARPLSEDVLDDDTWRAELGADPDRGIPAFLAQLHVVSASASWSAPMGVDVADDARQLRTMELSSVIDSWRTKGRMPHEVERLSAVGHEAIVAYAIARVEMLLDAPEEFTDDLLMLLERTPSPCTERLLAEVLPRHLGVASRRRISFTGGEAKMLNFGWRCAARREGPEAAALRRTLLERAIGVDELESAALLFTIARDEAVIERLLGLAVHDSKDVRRAAYSAMLRQCVPAQLTFQEYAARVRAGDSVVLVPVTPTADCASVSARLLPAAIEEREAFVEAMYFFVGAFTREAPMVAARFLEGEADPALTEAAIGVAVLSPDREVHRILCGSLSAKADGTSRWSSRKRALIWSSLVDTEGPTTALERVAAFLVMPQDSQDEADAMLRLVTRTMPHAVGELLAGCLRREAPLARTVTRTADWAAERLAQRLRTASGLSETEKGSLPEWDGKGELGHRDVQVAQWHAYVKEYPEVVIRAFCDAEGIWTLPREYDPGKRERKVSAPTAGGQ